jgi:hypothetical protein
MWLLALARSSASAKSGETAGREQQLPVAFAEILHDRRPLPRSCVVPVQSCQDRDRTFEISGALIAAPNVIQMIEISGLLADRELSRTRHSGT